MLIPIAGLFEKYKLKVTGIVHVGAHEGQEKIEYNRLGITDIIWIEANPLIFDKLKEKCNPKELSKQYPNINFSFDSFLNWCVSDKIEELDFNITNNEQSSSILPLKTHASHYPDIKYINKVKVKTHLLSELNNIYEIWVADYNFFNLDIQGCELKALKGYEKYLKNVDYIYTEVNTEEVYEGCARLEELDEFLFNYVRVEINLTQQGWGDAFYIKRKLLKGIL